MDAVVDAEPVALADECAGRRERWEFSAQPRLTASELNRPARGFHMWEWQPRELTSEASAPDSRQHQYCG